MRHQRSTGRFLRLSRLTSIAEDLDVVAVLGLDFGSGLRRRSFALSIPVGSRREAVDTSESLRSFAPFVDPDDGRVDGGDWEVDDGEADEEDARPVASGFKAEASASRDKFGDSADICGLDSTDLD